MTRPTFAYQPKPFLVNVIQKLTPGEAMANIHNAEMHGATSHDLHLHKLKQEYLNEADLRRIFECTVNPVLVLNYRYGNTISDEERIEKQLLAIECGAAGADIPMYSYCEDTHATLKGIDAERYPFVTADPNEVCMDAAVVARQKALIDRIHGMGGEVLMSAHVGVELDREQAVALALEIQSRGADVIKIVTTCQTEDHLAEMIGTIGALDKVMEKPFLYMGTGRIGRLTRIAGPMLGACLCFCNLEYNEWSTPDQPTLDYMFRILKEGQGYWKIR